MVNQGNENAVLKKDFVKKEYRKHGILTQLYEVMMTFAKEKEFSLLLFDTIIPEDFEKAREVVKVTKAKTPSNGKNSILTGYLECGCRTVRAEGKAHPGDIIKCRAGSGQFIGGTGQ